MNDNDLIRNRLIAYIDRRKQAGGIDYERIHSFDIGSSTQVDLLTSDIEALTLERAAQLADPNAVHANMLRGTIAKPTVAQIIHIYGRDPILQELAMRGAVHETAEVTAARVVKIKPLVWSGELSWEWKAAQTSIGKYLVQECDCGGTTLKLNHREVWHSENRNEEAAKAAAQAHYEACIRSAIVEGGE